MIKKLLNLKLKFTKNQKGLTLIELLVVIVILGIIAAIAIPAIMNQRTTAEENANAQTLSVLLDATKRYNAVTGEWPAAGADTLAAVLVPEYIDEIPATCADGETPATYTFALPTGDTAATLTSNCS